MMWFVSSESPIPSVILGLHKPDHNNMSPQTPKMIHHWGEDPQTTLPTNTKQPYSNRKRHYRSLITDKNHLHKLIITNLLVLLNSSLNGLGISSVHDIHLWTILKVVKWGNRSHSLAFHELGGIWTGISNNLFVEEKRISILDEQVYRVMCGRPQKSICSKRC